MFVIVFNSFKQKSEAAVIASKEVLKKNNITFETISSFPFNKKDLSILKKAELLIIIGGDGTILSTLSHKECRDKIILPVNSGTLGFISSVKISQIKNILSSFLKSKTSKTKQNYKIETRPYLRIIINKTVYHAINDAVISRGNLGKLINIEAKINKIKTLSFRADGLIVSTPTGSTGYNISAGGPILHPSIKAIIFNPICPHSLTLRPIVLPGNDEIEITARHRESEEPISLILDGITKKNIKPGEPITIKLENKNINFLKPIHEHYYGVLKEKMFWGK